MSRLLKAISSKFSLKKKKSDDFDDDLKFTKDKDVKIEQDGQTFIPQRKPSSHCHCGGGDSSHNSCHTSESESDATSVITEIPIDDDVAHDGVPVHFQSHFVPITYNGCWTIKDFPTAVNIPKVLNSYRLKLQDSKPPVQFRLRKGKNNVLYLKVKVLQDKKDAIIAPNNKQYDQSFIKYGFSVGPHITLGQDFTLESPMMLLKDMKKSHLTILDTKRLIHSYLVNGDLNLIVRFIVHVSVTQPLKGSGHSSRALINKCSQFTLNSSSNRRRDNNNVDDDDDERWSYVYNSDPVKKYKSLKDKHYNQQRALSSKVTLAPFTLSSLNPNFKPSELPKNYVGAVTGDFVRIRSNLKDYPVIKFQRRWEFPNENDDNEEEEDLEEDQLDDIDQEEEMESSILIQDNYLPVHSPSKNSHRDEEEISFSCKRNLSMGWITPLLEGDKAGDEKGDKREYLQQEKVPISDTTFGWI